MAKHFSYYLTPALWLTHLLILWSEGSKGRAHFALMVATSTERVRVSYRNRVTLPGVQRRWSTDDVDRVPTLAAAENSGIIVINLDAIDIRYILRLKQSDGN